MHSRAKVGVVFFSTVLVILMVIGGVLGKSTTSDEPYRQLRVYSEVLSRIRSDYVEEPDLRNVTVGALHGLLESLDPFSSYLSPEQYAQYQKRKSSGNADLGLVLSKKFGYVAIISAVSGGPAARSGLQSGDIIEAIEGNSTREMSLEEVKTLLAGTPGSTVNLSVVRVRRGEPQRMTLKREVVAEPPVTRKMVEPGIGYLNIDGFPHGRAREIAAHAQQLLASGARRLVVDVRGAASGDIGEGITAANLFVDHGLITYLQGQKVPRENFAADASRAVIHVPVVVLVNRGTAGAAEVFASAILENGRGDVVGEKTYGVGSVQKLIPLDDGSALLLSVAKYYTPGGKAIQDNGVTPNVAVTDTEPEEVTGPPEEQQQPEAKPQEKQPPKEDPILKKGIEVLKNQAEKKTEKAAA
jgi:carboxyl-terminal processing protease